MPERPFTVLAARTFRIGRQWLFRDATGQLYAAIQNRSYKSCHPVPEASLQRRLRAFRNPQGAPR